MLHFFRKIRRDLLANSQFFKYLKYAVGEIVLVVLGILIALYINKWSGERQNRELFDQTLIEIEQELVFNIKNIRVGLEKFHVYDSAYSIALFEGLSEKNFENDSLFLFRTLPYFFSEIQTEAFQKLYEIGPGRTKKQDSIFQNLTLLYGKDTLEFTQEMEKISIELNQKVSESRERYNWFFGATLDQPYTEEEVNYYIESPIYKRNLSKIARQTLKLYNTILASWEYRLLRNYNSIYKYLENDKIAHSDSLFFQYDPEQYKHYIGKYQFKESSGFMTKGDQATASQGYTEIEVINGRFIISFRNNNDHKEMITWGEVLPVNKYYFRIAYPPNPASGMLIFDDHNKVSGLEWGWTSFKYRQERID